MRRRLRMDVLKPSTEWCWLNGPREFALPGGSLEALSRALAAAPDEAPLVYRGWEYVLRWQDGPPRPEDDDTARAVRSYELTSRFQNRAQRLTGDERALPGPFVELVALTGDEQGAHASDRATTNLRDALWTLLATAAAALDAIG